MYFLKIKTAIVICNHFYMHEIQLVSVEKFKCQIIFQVNMHKHIETDFAYMIVKLLPKELLMYP